MTKVKNFVKRNAKGIAIGAIASMALLCVPKVGDKLSSMLASARVKVGGIA